MKSHLLPQPCVLASLPAHHAYEPHSPWLPPCIPVPNRAFYAPYAYLRQPANASSLNQFISIVSPPYSFRFVFNTSFTQKSPPLISHACSSSLLYTYKSLPPRRPSLFVLFVSNTSSTKNPLPCSARPSSPSIRPPPWISRAKDQDSMNLLSDPELLV